MSRGTWMFRTQDGTNPDGRPVRGVYMADGTRWEWMAPLPYVHARLYRRGPDDRILSTAYRLSATPDDPAVLVERDQLRSGEWSDLVGLALSFDDAIIRAAAAAITELGKSLPATELAARWRDGTWTAPPADVGPPGYGRTSGTEDDARAAWRLLVATMADHPKLALAVGAAVSGFFFGTFPDDLQSYICYMTGRARRGKSTGLMLGAGIYGNPTDVSAPMNVSPLGVTAMLSDLGNLPAFLDELGASGLGPADLEKLVFGIAQGGKRSVSKKAGGLRQSAVWHSVCVMTGNDSIVGRIANEGIGARVIELHTPIVNNADDAKFVKAVLIGNPEYGIDVGCWGWPYVWLQQNPRVADFHLAVRNARNDLPMPNGDVAETLAINLTLAVAGAARLAELCDGDTAIGDAAMSAAREVLERQIEEISDRGLTAGDRLYQAVMQAVIERPAAFPSEHKYEQMAADQPADGLRLASSVDGLIFDEGVAVLTSRLPGIAAANDLTDIQTALRQLRDSRALITSPGMALRYRRRVRGRRTEFYLLAHDETLEPEPVPESEPEAPAAPTPADPTQLELAPAAPAAPAEVVQAPAAPAGPPQADVEAFMRTLHETSDEFADIDEAGAWAAIRAFSRAFEIPDGANLGKPLIPSATPAVTGGRLFTMIQNKSGRNTDRLYRMDFVDRPDMELVHNWRRPLTEIELAMPWTQGWDVNFQFPAAASSALLGTGMPVHLGGRRGSVELDKFPAYYRVTVDPSHPACGGNPLLPPLVPGDGWYPQPVVEYLFKSGAILVLHEKWEWSGTGMDAPRKWLSLWATKLRDARALLRAHPDNAACAAAAEYVKLIGAAFLAGWLRSDKNRSELYRPDWSDAVIGIARTNQHRHMMRAWNGGAGTAPIGQYKDMLYYMQQSPDVNPGLPNHEFNPGKFKLDRIASADAIREALLTGGIGDLNSAMKHAHDGTEEGA